MGTLVVNMFTSLDGVLQGPGAPDEDRAGGFEYGGWQAPYADEESGKVITDHIAGLEALLLGRQTYEIFAAYWPRQPAENPIAARLNGAPKYVASRTLDTVGWANSKLIQGDVTEAVAQLKGEFGRVDVIGSGNFVQTLLRNDLVEPAEPMGVSGPARQRQAAVRGGHGADRAAAGGVGDLPQGRRAPHVRARRPADLRQHGLAGACLHSHSSRSSTIAAMVTMAR